jgi:prephenate dehydrogenase
MRSVAIFGVGLIGGSFALALRKAGFAGDIFGVSSPQTIEAALSLGVIDRGIGVEEAVDRADFFYLAQPILSILQIMAATRWPDDVVVTDAGSTKRQIAEQAAESIGNAFFIGGHPMAGKERAGVQNADADLFQGRPYVLCPRVPEDVDDPRFQDLRDWIIRIGAKPVILNASEHDRLVAFTSHAPQILSTALASVLDGIDGASSVAGPAVLELTRLAFSPFGIWRDILQTNEANVSEALSAVIAKLNEIKQILGSDELAQEFRRAASGAQKMREQPAKYCP